MSKTFDDFCGQYYLCTEGCPFYDQVEAPCRNVFEAVQEYLEKDEEES